MNFIQQHFSLIIGIVFVLIAVLRGAQLLVKSKKIEKEGIETTAVVTRVEDTADQDGASGSYITYVSFHDGSGAEHECPMALTLQIEHDPGEQVRIRYIPGEYELVREITENA